MARRPEISVAVSLDVEEEGLFRGQYERINPQVSNVRELERLAPLQERGIKPTFFCAYSVFADAGARKILEAMRDKYDAEIGAHLHHWNTPPLDYSPRLPEHLCKVPAAALALKDMDKKLAHLVQIANNFQGAPVTSFRMGRWDLHRRHWPLLAKHGILTDASVRPLHSCLDRENGPDHFEAPFQPYRVQCGQASIFEVPLTVTPLLPGLTSVSKTAHLRASLKKWGALALLPTMHPLWLMKLTTRMHVSRGGSVLSLTWHSSELQPGGAPHMKDEKAVRNLLEKLAAYLDWLDRHYSVSYETMSGLRERLEKKTPLKSGAGDWTCA